ncbi:MAG: transporter substrate-binding protein [Deltaproteobacteria bacterium]|nr:transporter substrate-binding protein [Deltaproteobacteria bacterium]
MKRIYGVRIAGAFMLIGISFLCFPFFGSAAEAPAVIKVGIVAPLSGPAAWAGVAIREGADLAAEEANNAGGIFLKDYNKKVKIEAIYGDSQSKPAIGVTVAEKLITKDQVHFLVGEAFHSSVTMAIMEMAPKYNIPFQSWMPVSNEISDKIKSNPKKYWNFWKGDFASDAYGKTIHDTYVYLEQKGFFKPKKKTIAFVIEETDFGRSNADVSFELMKKDGWQKVAYEVVPIGHNDFYPQLTKIRSLNPDVIVSCFTALNSGTAFIKQFRETGMTSSHMAIYYPLYPQLIQNAKEAADYLIWTPLLLNPSKIELQAKFQERFKKKYGKDINNQNGAGYDGMFGVITAFTDAGSIDPKRVVDSIAKTDYRAVLGRYKYNLDRHEIMDGIDYIPIPTAQIINGKNQIIWPPKMVFITAKS